MESTVLRTIALDDMTGEHTAPRWIRLTAWDLDKNIATPGGWGHDYDPYKMTKNAVTRTRDGRWRASIFIKTQIIIGIFDTHNEARDAYIAARKQHAKERRT